MGGIGSGKWLRPSPKSTVEECLQLDANRLRRQGILRPGAFGRLFWQADTPGKVLASVMFELRRSPQADLTLCLRYSSNQSPSVLTRIPIEFTYTHRQGLRWWLICPLAHSGENCLRRVAKLYLRDGEFGCRACHNLTYRSSQCAHQDERFAKRIAPIECYRAWRDCQKNETCRPSVKRLRLKRQLEREILARS